jgi:hypothetical protein
MIRYFFLLISLAVATIGAVFPASAEVEKFMRFSQGQMHPYYQLKFTPPKGWTEDKAATKQNGVPMYVPKGKSFGSAPALMYIKVSHNADKRDLEKFIEVAHGLWHDEVQDSKIVLAKSEKRDNGKPEFQVYHFENPSQKQQAYETMAYGEDQDKDGNSFFLMIALSGASQKALDGAEADYRAGLRAH